MQKALSVFDACKSDRAGDSIRAFDPARLSLSRTQARLLFDPCRYQNLTMIPGPIVDGRVTKGAANLHAGMATIERNDPINDIQAALTVPRNRPLVHVNWVTISMGGG